MAAAVTLVLALVVAPPDAIQGQSQRLMYVHVPSAWTAFCSFAVVWVASVAVLLTGRRQDAPDSPRGSRRRFPWDAVAQAAAELGVGLTGLAIAMGSIWGHTVWGVWWTWDPRLVTTAVLFLLYLGYLGVRGLPGDSRRVARRSAVVGVVAFVQVPIVHFSVLWWRTLHQPPTILAPDTSPPIDPLMLLALLSAVATSMLAALWYVRRRVAQLLPEPAAQPTVEQGGEPVPGTAEAPLLVTRGMS